MEVDPPDQVNFIDIVDLATFDPDKLMTRLKRVALAAMSAGTDCRIPAGEFD